jgi:hypothetical protein
LLRWVYWPTIKTDRDGSVAVLVDEALVAIVTRLAQRLQLAGQELVPVTAMRFDMIGNGRERDAAAIEAHGTERFAAQLVASYATPAFELIPLSPWSLPCGRLLVLLHADQGMVGGGRDAIHFARLEPPPISASPTTTNTNANRLREDGAENALHGRGARFFEHSLVQRKTCP